MATIREYRQRQARRRAVNTVNQEGVAGFAIGESPLTIWLVTAIIIVYLYIRRSHLGIDTHPAEKSIIRQKFPLPTVTIPGVNSGPYTPPTQPKLWGIPPETPNAANSRTVTG